MAIWWLIETTLVIALLAAVVTAACRILRCSPAVRHALWLVVLVKLLLPPVVPCPWSPLRYLDEALTPEERAGLSPPATSVDRDSFSAETPGAPAPRVRATWAHDVKDRNERSEWLARGNATATSKVTELDEDMTTSPGAATSGAATNGAATNRMARSYGTVAAWLVLGPWLMASFVVASRQSLAIWRLSHLSRRGRPAPRWLEDQVTAVAAMLCVRPPRLVVVDGIRTPFVWCLGRPRLYWPSSLVEPSENQSSQDTERWRGVIAHELAHLGRRDHWVAWIELPAGWLWWWNPVFWYVRSQLRESAELACDAWVVAALPRSRRAYAETLVEVSELVSKTVPLVPVPVLSASTGAGRAFERRLTMILRERVPCKLSWRGVVGVGLLTLVAVPSWLIAQSPAAKQSAAAKPSGGSPAAGPVAGPVEVSGHVLAVDAAKSTLQIGGKQVNATYSVAPNVRVILDDGTGDRFGFQEGKFADVAEGQPVIVRLSPDRKEVIGIWVEGPSVRGTLKALDAVNRSITVAVALTKGEPEQDKTFAVAETAKVLTLSDMDDKNLKNGKGLGKGHLEAGRLADLPVGAVVSLKLSADQKTAGRVQAEAPSVHGVLQGIDAAKNTLTLRVSLTKGEPGTDHTYELAKDVHVSLDGGSGNLSDLSPGALVTLKLSANQKVVLGIQAEGPAVHGIIKAFDAATNMLTLRVVTKGEPDVEGTYELAKQAKVTIDGEAGKLSDVPTDAILWVKLSANQKAISSIQVEGGHAIGIAKVVDADNRSITIEEKEGDRTLSVAKNAAISVDEKPATLADVPVEATVIVHLSADQKVARSLSAQGRHVQGIVKVVDGVNHEITIDIPKEGEAKFKLAEGVKVEMTAEGKAAAKPGKLADVKPDAKVTLQLSADQKTVRRVTVVED